MNKIGNTRKGKPQRGKQTQKKQKIAINKQKQKQKKLKKSINNQPQKQKKQKKAVPESTSELHVATVTETMNDGTECVRFKIIWDNFGKKIEVGQTYWVNNTKRTLRWDTVGNLVWYPPIYKKNKN
jgi:hypothetical protein